MKSIEEINAIMETIPTEWQERWCGGENGPCACMGCVQIGNRLIMTNRKVHQGDPEYIDESKIDPSVYKNLKITRDEWELWRKQ